ncbi:hypothetical protein BH11MYX4_BH11MYX4_26710 [soil metagenome]
MRWTLPLAGIAFLVLGLYACDTTSSTGGAIEQDASADSPAPDSGLCCPPDPHPGCCMAYGGKPFSSGCSEECDGMPVPSDPDWKIGNDPSGCPRWMNPHDHWNGGTYSADTKYCGAVSHEDDAGSNDASDAADAADAADASDS